MPHMTPWARVWPVAKLDTRPHLRSGAWYPVVSRGPDRDVVLEVRHHDVPVPQHLVEIRDERPARFTVVYRGRRARNPALGTDKDLGRVYAVCPASGHRLPLRGSPSHMECPRCGYRGPIAWGETG